MKPTHTLSALIAVGALSLTACSASQVAATSEQGSASAAPVTGAESVVRTAQAELAKYTAEPPFVAPNDPFAVAGLRGKRVAIVAVDQTTPSLLSTIKGAQAAAKVAGLETTVYDAKDTPSEMTAGVAQAVAAHVDAIVLVGVSAALVSAQLASARSAGIPVVMANNSQPDAKAPGQGAGAALFANSAPDYRLQGRLAADAAIVRSGGAAKAILVTTDGIDPAPAVSQGFEDGLAACSTCEVLDRRHVQLQDWFNGNLASLTTSALSTNKDANIVLPIYVTMAMFMVPAAQQAGKAGKVTFFSTSAPPDGAALLAANASLGGLAGMSDDYVGWLAINQAMRGMLELAPGNPTVPTRYLTGETVKKAGTSGEALYGIAYQAGFRKLWGLG
ncbi:substrate-binding domain-containing protein [Amycolatopsis rhabdoformis]|uniref:Substrate-binding domain-containing protein n=1 Tax=Amycolatopsis rhabdoformis TaxID=1448059 RepID=A0ABZ1III7_9PSEU|nr:substrate-binding domain-containing protein [Amycolatopsis rhabdoformis]WSE33533.1 substrate-binding domain-containing protein [Amycolatopsis rhabdoformis]